jgi:hypothetical protein
MTARFFQFSLQKRNVVAPERVDAVDDFGHIFFVVNVRQFKQKHFRKSRLFARGQKEIHIIRVSILQFRILKTRHQTLVETNRAPTSKILRTHEGSKNLASFAR